MMTKFETRALASYFHRGGKELPTTPRTETLYNRQYVVLENPSGVLAIYRITNQGHLKYLSRPPKELLAMQGAATS
jgi:hypothetical protein